MEPQIPTSEVVKGLSSTQLNISDFYSHLEPGRGFFLILARVLNISLCESSTCVRITPLSLPFWRKAGLTKVFFLLTCSRLNCCWSNMINFFQLHLSY